MAYTTVPTVSAGDVWTAGNQNTYVRDNINGLLATVKIVSVKYAEFTGTQSASLDAGNNVAITDLSISHALAKSTNKVLLLAQVGQTGHNNTLAETGIAFAVDGTLISVGDSPSARIPVGAVGKIVTGATYAALSHFIQTVYEPATVAEKIYTLRAINAFNSTKTVYINRAELDTDNGQFKRAVSSLLLIELEG